jgi:hypothetical protein
VGTPPTEGTRSRLRLRTGGSATTTLTQTLMKARRNSTWAGTGGVMPMEGWHRAWSLERGHQKSTSMLLGQKPSWGGIRWRAWMTAS